MTSRFLERDEDARFIIYLLVADGQVIYIGQTGRLDNRLKIHRRNGLVFEEVHTERATSRPAALHREAELIHQHHPVFNGYCPRCVAGNRQPRGICGSCHGIKVVRADGTMRGHWDPATGRTCAGSYNQPFRTTAVTS